MKVSVIQMQARETREKSMEEAAARVREAARMGADFAMLPEMFSCPYETAGFPLYAEAADGETVKRLSEIAGENGIYLVGGSIPEQDENGKIYNTSFVFDRKGKLLARHRKVHLFDIDIQGGQSFKESDTLSPGESATVFSTKFGPMGLCICFDVRFPELFREMAEKGALAVFCPAAFNRTTGPKHWELLFRARAVDYQLFTIGAAPAADETASYISYGHSILVSPWGEVLSQAGEEECILTEELDLSQVEAVRRQIPIRPAP
ncbi:MAG: carbon-nitrogen hydrolase family protein [Lachnospiraceae bacterium]|jgi:omega-amidase|nr:carbon-nitrogen hydrolase family protein [Lachnospiraceae bacterium]